MGKIPKPRHVLLGGLLTQECLRDKNKVSLKKRIPFRNTKKNSYELLSNDKK